MTSLFEPLPQLPAFLFEKSETTPGEALVEQVLAARIALDNYQEAMERLEQQAVWSEVKRFFAEADEAKGAPAVQFYHDNDATSVVHFFYDPEDYDVGEQPDDPGNDAFGMPTLYDLLRAGRMDTSPFHDTFLTQLAAQVLTKTNLTEVAATLFDPADLAEMDRLTLLHATPEPSLSDSKRPRM